MGYTPCQVDRMSLWEFAACSDGYSGKRNSGGGDLDEDQLAEMGIEGFN